MYLKAFGLKEFPFRLTPDSDFLFMSTAHSRAKAYMDYSIWNRDGFVVITGEVGSGKTTLLQKLLSELDGNVSIAKVFQTQLDEVELLQAIALEFGLDPFNAKKVQLIDMLNSFLIENFKNMKQTVVVVDDAHNLSARVLEEIRLLSGLETRKQKLLNVILLGQPELNERLEAPGMEQLLQRVRLRYHLKPLTEAESEAYINHRLRVAGASREIFTHETVPLINNYTGGVPRLINTLCDTALTCAYAENQQTVTTETVAAACEELQWLPYAKRINRTRKPSAASSTKDTPSIDQRRLNLIEGKLQNIEAMIPAVAAIATHMSEINTTLKQIADLLDRDKNPQSDKPWNHFFGKK